MTSPRFFCTLALALCTQTAVQAQVSITPTQPIQEDVDLTEDSQTVTAEARGFQTVTYEGVDLEVVKAAVNPANGELAIALERNPVVIWDAEAQSIVREFADIHLEWESVVYSPDGRFLAGGTYDGTVVLYDSATGQAIHTLTVGVPARNLSFNDDSSKVVISGQYILDTADFALTPLNEAYAVCMGIGGAFLPKSNRLFTIGFNNYCVWDTTDFSVTAQSSNSEYTDGAYTAIAASPNGEAVVISSKPVVQPDTLILDPEGQVKHHLALGQSSTGFGEVHFSADGSTVALTSGGLESLGIEVVILEPLSGEVLKRYDEANLQIPLQYSIYGSVVINPRTLLLVHNNAGLNFIDITQETNAAVTIREEELARVAAIPEVEQSAPAPVNDEVTEDEADVQPPAVPEANDSQVDNGEQLSFETITDAQLFDIASNGSADRVQEIFDLGFGANYPDESGRTLLMYAASDNDPAAIEVILAAGAEINRETEAGWTALMYAARDNSLDVVETLVENGASFDLTNEDGNTALNLASTSAVERFLINLLEPVQITEEAEPAEPVQQGNQLSGVVEAFGENTLHGRYIRSMLEYTSVVEIECPDLGVEDTIDPSAIDNVCVRGTDDVPFVEDVNAFLAENTGGIRSSSEWVSNAIGLPNKLIVFTNGYQVVMADVTDLDFAIVSGSASLGALGFDGPTQNEDPQQESITPSDNLEGTATPGFYENTESGSDIYAMLDYAGVNGYTDCHSDLLAVLDSSVEDYLCFETGDDGAFRRGVEDYAVTSDAVSDSGGFVAMEGGQVAALEYYDGYSAVVLSMNGHAMVFGGNW